MEESLLTKNPLVHPCNYIILRSKRGVYQCSVASVALIELDGLIYYLCQEHEALRPHLTNNNLKRPRSD